MVRLASLLLSLLLSAPAWAGTNSEAPYGSNAKLGIDFSALGDETWCGPEVQISLTSEGPAQLTGNSEAFQQMLGRIRAVIQGGCKEVEIIRYLGNVDGAVISEGVSAAYNRWAYVPWRINGRAVNCKGKTDEEVCASRRDVFSRLETILVGLNGGSFTLERYLSTEPGADAQFSIGKVKGTISAVKAPDAIPFAFLMPRDYVDPMFRKLSAECKGDYSGQRFQDINEKTSFGTAACRTKKGMQTYFLVVKKYQDDLLVFAFTDFSHKPVAGEKLAKALSARLSLRDAIQ